MYTATTTCLQVLQQHCAPTPHFLSFLTLTLHQQRSRLDYRCSCLKTSNFVRASLFSLLMAFSLRGSYTLLGESGNGCILGFRPIRADTLATHGIHACMV